MGKQKPETTDPESAVAGKRASVLAGPDVVQGASAPDALVPSSSDAQLARAKKVVEMLAEAGFGADDGDLVEFDLNAITNRANA
jgi:hypothetical protein